MWSAVKIESVYGRFLIICMHYNMYQKIPWQFPAPTKNYCEYIKIKNKSKQNSLHAARDLQRIEQWT